MMNTSIQCLINLQLKCLDTSGDQRRFPYRRTEQTINLRPEQKHIFTSNLKYQILLDSVQGRGPGMFVTPYCALPELEGSMNVWQFMEMIHSRSYTYIIKNVYPNPAEVFDTILDDEKDFKEKQTL